MWLLLKLLEIFIYKTLINKLYFAKNCMILSTLVTWQCNFEKCSKLCGHPVYLNSRLEYRCVTVNLSILYNNYNLFFFLLIILFEQVLRG